MSRKVVVTTGDPYGIGPQVIAKSLAKMENRSLENIILVGAVNEVRRFLPQDKKDIVNVMECINLLDEDVDFGRGYSKSYALCAIKAIDIAIDLAKKGRVSGICTAPVSKEKISEIVGNFSGHTEYLARELRQENRSVEMSFVWEKDEKYQAMVLVTRHIRLRDVLNYITEDRIKEVVRSAAYLQDILNARDGIVVCGINPHAGEGGILGDEEIWISDVLNEIKKTGIDIKGVVAADTVFRRKFSVVVSMYHDQLLPAIKLMWPDSVNLTVGLKVVRTSPCHGTAFDIAPLGTCDFRSMFSAIKLSMGLKV